MTILNLNPGRVLDVSISLEHVTNALQGNTVVLRDSVYTNRKLTQAIEKLPLIQRQSQLDALEEEIKTGERFKFNQRLAEYRKEHPDLTEEQIVRSGVIPIPTYAKAQLEMIAKNVELQKSKGRR
jgi:hypothetical protein